MDTTKIKSSYSCRPWSLHAFQQQQRSKLEKCIPYSGSPTLEAFHEVK